MSYAARVELEPAYILHTRPYRETSLILEVFTSGYGRAGLVARGARRPQSPLRGILNPFQPLRLSWVGGGELGTLGQAEQGGISAELRGDAVMAGFYVHELLLKLLQRHDPHPQLFGHYATLLASLADGQPVEKLLRIFELELLREIGYALSLDCDALKHEILKPQQLYVFRPEQGAVPAEHEHGAESCFSGAELLAIGRLELDDVACLRNAKRLLRHVLDYHLGGKLLQTRRVAGAMKR
jgi:DNA repair protein RecO (recombination protein O)